MGRTSSKIPTYRRHSNRDVAFVEVQGKRVYFPGRYGSSESRSAYSKWLLAWDLNQQQALEPANDLRVIELCARFKIFACKHYRKNGRLTNEVSCYEYSIEPLLELFAKLPAAEFGPKKLATVRELMIRKGWARTTINSSIGRIRRLFRWGVAEELVPATVWEALRALQGLQAGRTDAREPDPILPVDVATVEATIAEMPKVPADMVRLQLASGMRPSEVCNLRPCDVDRSGEVWTYRPADHKMMHKGRERVVYLGPKAQSILLPYLLRADSDYCFSPTESRSNVIAERNAKRKTPATYGNCIGSNRKPCPKRKPGARYDVAAYRRAITRAAELASVEPWAPNRLRHTAATLVRDRFGIEAVQAILGHSEIATSQIYAERSERVAIEVAKACG